LLNRWFPRTKLVGAAKRVQEFVVNLVQVQLCERQIGPKVRRGRPLAQRPAQPLTGVLGFREGLAWNGRSAHSCQIQRRERFQRPGIVGAVAKAVFQIFFDATDLPE